MFASQLLLPSVARTPSITPARHVARMRALGLVPASSHAHVRIALAGLALDVALESDLHAFTAMARGEGIDLVVIDADIAGDLARLRAAVRPAARIAVLTGYWSEREPVLREIADVVLYKPPRRGDWQRALARAGVLSAAA